MFCTCAYMYTCAYIANYYDTLCTEDNMIQVNQFIKARSHNLWFEAKLIKSNQENAKTVFCYISPKVS